MNALEKPSSTPAPVINEYTSNLSLGAIGLLLQMSNLPELDYCTKEDIYRSNPTGSHRRIDRAIDELLAHKCLVEMSDHRLAVNKSIIVQQMHLVHGNLLLRMEG